MRPESPTLASPAEARPLRLHHLMRLTGPFGLFEHADHDRPRAHLGYTTDDNARLLVVLSRLPSSPEALELYQMGMRFLFRGRTERGWHNRLGPDGRWHDVVGSDDCHGRALWALGVAARHAPMSEWRTSAGQALEQAPSLVSPHARSNAFAVLGAVDALAEPPWRPQVADLLEWSAAQLPRPRPGPWRWPEERLTYANARLPEALIAAGELVGDEAMLADGLELLEWLVSVESAPSGFSFTPVGGRGPVHAKPGFDQQPIEAWAMADACHRAEEVTGEREWGERWRLACAWFLGANDLGVRLYDPRTGAGYDGLTPSGVNLNRGAESTLAALGSLALLPEA